MTLRRLTVPTPERPTSASQALQSSLYAVQEAPKELIGYFGSGCTSRRDASAGLLSIVYENQNPFLGPDGRHGKIGHYVCVLLGDTGKELCISVRDPEQSDETGTEPFHVSANGASLGAQEVEAIHITQVQDSGEADYAADIIAGILFGSISREVRNLPNPFIGAPARTMRWPKRHPGPRNECRFN